MYKGRLAYWLLGTLVTLLACGKSSPPGGGTAQSPSQEKAATPPVAVAPGLVWLLEDDSATISLEDSVAEDPAPTVEVTQLPQHGVLSPVSGPAPLQVTYTPDADFFGFDAFELILHPASGPDSAPAVVTLAVTAVNDAPVAANDSAATDSLTSSRIDVMANDSDVDGDALHVTGVGTPTPKGAATLQPDGSILFAPEHPSSGEMVFTYTVADTHGAEATATVTVNVTLATEVGITSFTADPTLVTPGTSADLSWAANSVATSCTIDQGVDTGGATSGTVQVSPVATTIYTLSCEGPVGPALAQATVEVASPAQITSFVADPPLIFTGGGDAVLRWQTTDATSCDIDQGVGTGMPANGSTSVRPDATTTYALTCQGPIGVAVVDSATVTVQRVHYVDKNAPPSVGIAGSSWAEAATDVQSMVDAAGASGGEVWVKAGSYTSPNNSVVSITSGLPMAVYGGFAGNETLRDQRDPSVWRTRLVGNGTGPTVTISGVDNVRIDGFEISGGLTKDGGGIRVMGANGTTIANTTVSANRAQQFGGGIGITGSTDVSIEDSAIMDNISQRYGAGLGIYASSVTVLRSLIISNRVTQWNAVGCANGDYGCVCIDTAACVGGGIDVQGTTPSLTVEGSQILGNLASAGGGIALRTGTAVVTDSQVTGNRCTATALGTPHEVGGGIYTAKGTTLEIGTSRIDGNVAQLNGGGLSSAGTLDVVNSSFSGNAVTSSSGGAGGGIYLELTSPISITSTSVIGNSAQCYAGVMGSSNGGQTITNAVIAGNQSSCGTDIAATLAPAVSFTCVNYDSIPDKLGTYTQTAFAGQNNVLLPATITGDPQAYPGGPGYLENAGVGAGIVTSPCVDAGNDAFANGLFDWQQLSTRADDVPDRAPIDLGMHHAPAP